MKGLRNPPFIHQMLLEHLLCAKLPARCKNKSCCSSPFNLLQQRDKQGDNYESLGTWKVLGGMWRRCRSREKSSVYINKGARKCLHPLCNLCLESDMPDLSRHGYGALLLLSHCDIDLASDLFSCVLSCRVGSIYFSNMQVHFPFSKLAMTIP